MKNDYIIGYLSKEYVKNICYLYLVGLAINLLLILLIRRSINPSELFFAGEPLVYIGLYFSMVIAWNYTREEETRGNSDRRSVIYFKSVGFLYLTMVVINLFFALYAETGIDFEVLVVNNDHKFYTISILYGIFELYDGWGSKTNGAKKL